MASPVDPRAPSLPAVVILGNDAQLAARPATPVQLAHACLAAGFRAAIPASWGDELVAAASLDMIASRGMRPAIHCACPHVARRMLAVGTELAPHLVSLVAPPVAVAKYVRLHAPQGVRVTYIGRCPAASDDSIDARLTPEEFLAQLAERGIDPGNQPEVFESVIPPDRRRHLSIPGGVPAPDELWRKTQLRVETLHGDDVAADIAERVLARADVLLDPAPAMGCACAGAARGVAPEAARPAIVALEPPRSPFAVVELQGTPSLELPIPTVARSVTEVLDLTLRPDDPRRTSDAIERANALSRTIETSLGAPSPTPAADAPPRRPCLTPPGSPVITTAPIAASPPPPSQPAATPAAATPSTPRRRHSSGVTRVPPGAVPVASDQEGRLLPRAYVARRRSPRGGTPAVTEDALGTRPPMVESERQIERSVEPVAPPPEPPAAAVPAPVPEPVMEAVAEPIAAPVAEPALEAVAQPVAIVPSPSAGPVERSLTFLTANPRATLIVALTVAGLLAGVLIGFAATRRGDAPRSEATGIGDQRLRFDSSAASAAPPLTSRPPRPTAPAPSRTATPPRRTVASRRGGIGEQGPRQRVAEPPASAGAGGAGSSPAATVQPATPAPAVVDSAPIRARRDSAIAAARAESLAAEREAIRREIERRRARIDSIIRAQGGSPPQSP